MDDDRPPSPGPEPADDASAPAARPGSARRLLVVAVLVVVAFLGGFLWQFAEARAARAERDALQSELAVEEMGGLLASAVIQVHNGGYENARRLMSDFFSRLQTHVAGTPGASSGEADRQLADLLDRRDDVITALSRSEPSAESLLTRMYLRYEVATGGPEQGIPVPGPAPDTDTAGGAAPPS